MPTKRTYDPFVRHAMTVDAAPDSAFGAFLADLPARWHPSLNIVETDPAERVKSLRSLATRIGLS